MYQVLARKWRPKTFHELVGQSHVTQALTYALENNRIHHAYLFTGTRGVGKTTIARIYAKSLNCLTNGVSANPCGYCENCSEIDEGRFPDLIEVDAASRRGIDETRDLLDSVAYAPVKGRFKVYLIDEVHMFTRESFNALLKTLEEPPEHVRFILATTDPQKLPATILSRCLQFHLKNMTSGQISEHLADILNQENIPFEKNALSLLAEAANGSMRDSLSLTDQAISFGQGSIKTSEVASLLGAIPETQLRKLFSILADGNAAAMRQRLYGLDAFAPDYADLLKRLLMGLQQITVSQLGAERSADEIDAEIAVLARRLPVELVQLWYQIATETWQNLPYQPDARSAIEMMLLRMIALQPLLPEQSLAEVAAIPGAKPESEVLQPQTLVDMAEKLSQQQIKQVEPEELTAQTDQQNAVSPEPGEKIPFSENISFSEHDEEFPPILDKAYDEAAKKKVEQVANTQINLADTLNQPEKWNTLLQSLVIEDEYTLLLAEHCCPATIEGEVLHIKALSVAKMWAKKLHIDRLSYALSHYYQRPLTVEISQDDAIETPMSVKRKHDVELRVHNEELFMNHPTVQTLINELGARVIPGSIQSLENLENKE